LPTNARTLTHRTLFGSLTALALGGVSGTAQSPALFDASLLHLQPEEFTLLGDVDLDGDTDAIGFLSVGQTLLKSQARVFWNDGRGNLSAGPVLVLPTDVGNQVAYAIHRLCSGTGAPAGANCDASPTSRSGEGGSKSNVPQPSSPSAVYYRITVRVQGPRNATSFIQAVVAI